MDTAHNTEKHEHNSENIDEEDFETIKAELEFN